jgi:hypothetical protein
MSTTPNNSCNVTNADVTPEVDEPCYSRDVVDRRSGLDRRRGPGRRRTEYRREAEDGHMNDEQLAFILAMEEFKSANNVSFPTWTDVLDVVLYLGYRKVAPIGEHAMTTRSDDDSES